MLRREGEDVCHVRAAQRALRPHELRQHGRQEDGVLLRVAHRQRGGDEVVLRPGGYGNAFSV